MREDAALEAYLIDRRIALEVCPTSNVQTRVVGAFGEHPIERYRRLGALVTVNTDNTMMSGVTLTEEFVSCAEHLGWSFDTLREVALNGFEAAFAPHALRLSLRAAAEREFAQLSADVPPVFLSATETA